MNVQTHLNPLQRRRLRHTLVPVADGDGMEFFAAATGCSDPKVASLYLERAGNDVGIAINHFLDAPPVDSPSTAPRTQSNSSNTNISSSNRSTASAATVRGAKRPRSVPRGVYQEVLRLQPAWPSRVVQCTSNARDSKKAGDEGGVDANVIGKEIFSSEQLEEGDGRAGAVPSAEWTGIVERCHR